MGFQDNPILTGDQKIFLKHLHESALRNHFYFTGGTALAGCFLRHRLSEDLDFFSEERVEIEEVVNFVRSLPTVRSVEYQHKFDRRIFLIALREAGLLKVEFTLYPFPRLEEGPMVEGIRVDSLRDILANKLMAMTDRRDPKDYVDLYFASKKNPGIDLERLVCDAESKFGVGGLKHILRARFLETLPSLGTMKMCEPMDPDALADFFRATARKWIAASLNEEE